MPSAMVGRPILLRLTEGRTSDYKGAAMMVDALPPAKRILVDRGYAVPDR